MPLAPRFGRGALLALTGARRSGDMKAHLSILAVLLVAGCGGNGPDRAAQRGPASSSTSPPATTVPPQSAPPSSSSATKQTLVRGVMLSPDAPPVDVVVDGKLAARAAKYAGTSPSIAIPPGKHDVQGLTAGTTTALFDFPVTIATGAQETLLAVGPIASVQPLLLQDDDTPAPTGFARLRVVQAIAAPVDVYVVPSGVLGAKPTATPRPRPRRTVPRCRLVRLAPSLTRPRRDSPCPPSLPRLRVPPLRKRKRRAPCPGSAPLRVETARRVTRGACSRARSSRTS